MTTICGLATFAAALSLYIIERIDLWSFAIMTVIFLYLAFTEDGNPAKLSQEILRFFIKGRKPADKEE
jgi:hypothetical protein